MDDALEVLEFRAAASSVCAGPSLQELPIREDVLLAAIIRNGKCLIPRGSDVIQPGDSVLAVTTRPGMTALEDILVR
jgi:trk system potassium uptake protein TrkA